MRADISLDLDSNDYLQIIQLLKDHQLDYY